MKALENEVKLQRGSHSWSMWYRVNHHRVNVPTLCGSDVFKYVDIPPTMKAIVLVFSDKRGPDKFKFSRNTRHPVGRHPWIISGTKRAPLYQEMYKIFDKQSKLGNSYFHFEYE